MAAPIVKQLTFCKLSSSQRIFGGIGSVRFSRVMKNYKKDRTPQQQYKNDPNRIDETPGPWKNYTHFDGWRKQSRTNEPYDPNRLNTMLEDMNFDTENDLPVDMPDPYTEPPRRCILCQHDIEITYKNPQLLSQFISTYTGRIYGRHITGLCLHMQRRVSSEIRLAQRIGWLPSLYKQEQYMEDPLLFNPFQKKTYPPGQ